MESCALNHPVKRVEFTYPRADIRHPDSGVARFREDHIVWWYNSILVNTRGVRTIPEVEVMFRRLNNGVPSSAPSWALVPLTSLPHYQIGTIWREGRCISDTEMEERTFDVDFSPGKWKITSRAALLDTPQRNIFHPDDYPLKYPRDLSTLLIFSLPETKTLIIPCIEYLVRAYARNMAVCKALTTLTLDEVKSVFFKCQQRDAFRWIIEPTNVMRDTDAAFLAHFLYDDYTESQVRMVNSSFVSKGPDSKVFPQVGPWFQGTGQLLCRGRWINKGKTFLCLSLLGSTQPQGHEIDLLRETFDSSGGKDEGRMAPPEVVRTARAEEFLEDESYSTPDLQSERLMVKTPPFKTLGPRRAVRKITSVRESNRGTRGPRPEDAESYSSGDAMGDGKRVGQSEHVSDVVLESEGFLLDIWNAFQSIKSDNPERVSEVSWYAPPDHGTSSPPRMILFNRDDLGWAERNWVAFDSWEPERRRGFMILRIVIDKQAYYCFEIERMEPSKMHPEPRGFSGALMKAHTSDPKEFQEFVTEVCRRIRISKGVFKNIMTAFPEGTIDFPHRSADQEIPYRKGLIDAFTRVDVVLK